MNRSIVSCASVPERHILSSCSEYDTQVRTWTNRLLRKEECVPGGYKFQWSRGDTQDENTAYLYDAIMCNVQFAQTHLQKADVSVGKLAYKHALKSAETYAFILQELYPQWTFRPSLALPDIQHADLYGHYCLARATAYNAVGKADLTCSDAARIAATSNAAHLYTVAAQLISGDVSSMLDAAQRNVGDTLALHARQYLNKWEQDDDDRGACKALACYQEADRRYVSAGNAGCPEKVTYAYERNQVHWLPPELPEFGELLRTRVTALHSH